MILKLDQSSDQSHKQLHRLFNGIKVASFVNDADIDSTIGDPTLEKEAFADVHFKAFPINNPASVYVSNAFFLDKKAELEKRWGKQYVEDVASRIKTAGEVFKIEADLADFTTQFLAKTAQDYPEQYIYECEWAGYPAGFYKVKTAEDFVRGYQDFEDNMYNFTFKMRKGIAEGFCEKAAEYGIVSLPDVICKYAGMFFPDTGLIRTDLSRRIGKTSSETLKGQYKEFQKTAEDCSTRDEVFKLAESVFDAEATAGVYTNIKTAKDFRDPVDSFFTISFEKAAEILSVVPMAGENFKLAELSQIPAVIYKEAFGVDIDPYDTTALCDTLPTMPLSDVSLFKELSGIRAA